MLLKLPILINGKKIDHNFKIKINNNKLELSSLSNLKIVNIVCFNKGVYNKVIYLPMIFNINKNILYNEFFFYNYVSENNENDFFHKMIKIINSKVKIKYSFYKNLKINIIQEIDEYYSKKYQLVYNFDNIDEFFNYTFYRSVYYLNWYLYQLSNEYTQINIDLEKSKKSKIIISAIKNVKILYNDSEYILQEIITNENINDIINHLFVFKYNEIIEIIISKIYKNNFYNLFYKYYLENNIDYLIYLKLLKVNISEINNEYKTYFNDILDISKENISFDMFKIILNKDTNYNKSILNNLFSISEKYSLIINKDKLNPTFKKIIYYTFKFIKKIKLKELSMNSKIKPIYSFIFNILKNVNNCNLYIHDLKLYDKYLYFSLFKIIFFNEECIQISKETNMNILFNFNKNIVKYNICKNINYFYINYQLDYYKYLFNNINKNNLYFDIMDTKVKDILYKPHILFNNMKDEVSIMKWLIIIRKNINNMYYQPIKINNNDIINLCKLLHFASKIKEQKLSCNNYKNFIIVSNKFKHLIIYNNRINLKINDIFPSKNINMGHLVKNIKNTTEVSLYKEEEQLNKYKMKYLKYKGKYLSNNN